MAISKNSNLALVRVDGLNGTPFTLSGDVPKPAQDVAISGFREPGFTNDTFQTRTATIVDLPNVLRHVDTSIIKSEQTNAVYRVAWFNYRDMLMHDAILAAGMEGAPLLDQHGRVLGVHIGNRPALGAFGSKYSLAEPASYAFAFLKPILPDIQFIPTLKEGADPIDSREVQEKTKSSIYQLAIQRRAPRLEWSHRIEELHRLQKQGSWTSYEDRTCMLCNGELVVECQNCHGNGSVKKKVIREIGSDAGTGKSVTKTASVSEDCPVCHGKGTVACPNCRNGIDNMLGH